MTGDQSRGLSVGARVCWGEDKNDRGTITERNRSGVTLKWDNRDKQSVSHNDMKTVFLIAGRTDLMKDATRKVGPELDRSTETHFGGGYRRPCLERMGFVRRCIFP